MAKARNITPVRERAIAAWRKGIASPICNGPVQVSKSRKKKTITVRHASGSWPTTWSYKGGSLRKVGA
jgi:hypothetical protein